MQIENIELIELFMETICDASEEAKQHPASRAATQITTLAQQLGSNHVVMENLADQYENGGEIKLALATRRLVNALANQNLMSSSEHESHKRILDYVYPVV
jgi:hypothetical protein